MPDDNPISDTAAASEGPDPATFEEVGAGVELAVRGDVLQRRVKVPPVHYSRNGPPDDLHNERAEALKAAGLSE
jgi:hypothetical protein